MNANLRNFALWVIIVLLLLALFTLFQNPGQRTTAQDISFSQLLTEVDQNHVRDVDRLDLGHDLVDRHLLPLRLPGSERRVAEPAAEIAAARADKDARGPGQEPLTLERLVNLRNSHGKRREQMSNSVNRV